MSSEDKQFVDSREEIPETNLDAAKEDAQTEESEVTGKIPTDEVNALKDNLGGGQILDDSEGYTRSSNKDVNPLQQEQAVDAAVDKLE